MQKAIAHAAAKAFPTLQAIRCDASASAYLLLFVDALICTARLLWHFHGPI